MNLIYTDNYVYAEKDTPIRDYDEEHYNLLLSYEDQEIGEKINKARIDLVKKYTATGPVLDYGCGSGYFIKALKSKTKILSFGYDVMEKSLDFIKAKKMYSDSIENFKFITMWDVIEHLPEPKDVLNRMKKDTLFFVAVPIYNRMDFDQLKGWKHYRPNEHLHYWNTVGFAEYMKDAGFMCIDYNEKETAAGRQDIKTFVFKKLV